MSTPENEIRKLPEQADRVETGAVQFGDDWPGVFFRGDNAFGYIAALDWAITELSSNPSPSIAQFTVSMLRGLRDTMSASDLTGISRSLAPASTDGGRWCVNVQGPDDIFAMRSKAQALEHANTLNIQFGQLDGSSEHPEHDPIMRAVVIEWPHDAESWAADLPPLASTSVPVKGMA